ncbi:MAG: glycerol-3-phosphate 1-O-acyltransferase PlsY [Magnetococcales bacterium]|nr:glycerol-3-phosphate 1-O-acyltransferase PlsY [Magnetococcales bacterium]
MDPTLHATFSVDSLLQLPVVLVISGSYLLGAIPFGLLVARLSGAGDIRRQGSGNIGATNVLRTAGRTAGAIALLLDMAKGAVAVLIARILAGPDSMLVAGAALAVFLGHLFPVYLRFKGGKGVATGLGIFFVWTPLAGLLTAGAWLLGVWVSRISSMGALVAFAVLPLVLFFQHEAPPAYVAGILTALVYWRHRGNMRRILDGTEPRIGQKR